MASTGPDHPGVRFLDPPRSRLVSDVYAQAALLDGLLLASGQCGWDTDGSMPAQLEAEVDRTLENVAAVLAVAELSWREVTDVVVYHVGPEAAALASAGLRRRVGSREPNVHLRAVPMLGPAMHLEVKVTAAADDGVAAAAIDRTQVHGGSRADGAVPDEQAEEIDLALARIGAELAAAGRSWSDVIELESWHRQLDMGVFEAMSAGFGKLLRHRPIWTCVGWHHPEPRVRHTMRATYLAPSP